MLKLQSNYTATATSEICDMKLFETTRLTSLWGLSWLIIYFYLNGHFNININYDKRALH